MAYTKTPASGMRNIQITLEGSYSVTVKGKYLGAFRDINLAIAVRDNERAKHNMKPVE